MTEHDARRGVSIHPTAIVDPQAQIGAGTRIWHWTQVREGVVIGTESIIGKGCYLDAGVQIGSRVKLQSNISVFHGVTIEDGVFVGPHVCFTNDSVFFVLYIGWARLTHEGGFGCILGVAQTTKKGKPDDPHARLYPI